MNVDCCDSFFYNTVFSLSPTLTMGVWLNSKISRVFIWSLEVVIEWSWSLTTFMKRFFFISISTIIASVATFAIMTDITSMCVWFFLWLIKRRRWVIKQGIFSNDDFTFRRFYQLFPNFLREDKTLFLFLHNLIRTTVDDMSYIQVTCNNYFECIFLWCHWLVFSLGWRKRDER